MLLDREQKGGVRKSLPLQKPQGWGTRARSPRHSYNYARILDSPSQGLGIKSGCRTRQTESLLCGSGGLSIEHRVNRRLGAFFTVATRHAHCANDLIVE